VNAEYVPFFHVGTLVRDIDQAAADFAKILGLRFEPVRSAPLVSGETMRFCYSLQGPPHLELVQMAETSIGLWGPEQGEGLHHIAFADPDVPGSCAAFGGQADTVVGGGEGGSGRVIFTRPEALHGIRVEYLQSAMVTATFERLTRGATRAAGSSPPERAPGRAPAPG
jgi:catechol 2,3-dioxygenase-like lactoylglutathione lyase family enzyme